MSEAVFPASPDNLPRIAALVLAAGCSRRMNGTFKLLAEVGGLPMVRHVVDRVCASGASPCVVVTGHQAEALRARLDDCDVVWVHNPDYLSGMASSLQRGMKRLATLPAEIDGVLVVLADMPYLRPDHFRRLMAAYEETGQIIVPVHGGQRGNPVLWPRRYFAEMQTLAGDQGARSLLLRYAAEVVTVEMDEAVLGDVDTPEALAVCQQDARVTERSGRFEVFQQ